ncbi:catalase family peroxidase [Acetobacter sacchari]|uniref:Catalase-related peroxidase n=1 Tax=Acetobacter sacchari TaxID=2661687 RepID=A0ABS3LYE1_9PROT|nr:catalase family peroxidase [Acetobacter sacchari]MBO1360930.1 catalase family peroxidase [Acetobacter sacchari]
MSLIRQKATEKGNLGRVGVVIGVPAALAFAFIAAAGWFTPDRLTPATVVRTFDSVDGPHPGFRRNHAKGVCVSGWFEGSGQASPYSSAALFRVERSPVIGRFALAGGQPYQDDAPDKVRSLALRIMPANGSEWRMGVNDIPVFLFRNARDFNSFLIASRPEATTRKPDPARIGAFLAAHPETARALSQIKQRSLSSGFADDAYNSLDTFLFVNADRRTTPVRWAIEPEQPVSTQNNVKAGRDYLFDDLTATLAEHSLRWKLMIVLGQPGDPTADPTVAWPVGRTRIDAGTLVLDKAEGEDGGPCTGITFDPLILPEGITPSDDPIPAARSAVYARSFTARSGETKAPSAINLNSTQSGK